METAHLPDILDGQFLARLIAGDGLMLGAVVHPYAGDVLHAGRKGKVGKEDRNTEDSFYKVQAYVKCDRVRTLSSKEVQARIYNETRQQDKEHDTEHQAENSGKDHETVAVLVGKLIELARCLLF